MYSLLARSFVCECHTISAVPRFQPPPRRTQHADFPHCALLFASPQGLWGLSCRSGFRRWSNHSVAIEQLQSLIQPSPTPPRPAEALSVPGSQHMAPDLRLHPVCHTTFNFKNLKRAISMTYHSTRYLINDTLLDNFAHLTTSYLRIFSRSVWKTLRPHARRTDRA